MEVEIRADKQGLNLPRRRKHHLGAQMLLILLTDVAHNLLSWLHAAILADGPCADFGTLRLVQDLLCIPGRLEYEGAELHKVALLDTHPYAAIVAAALTELLTQSTPLISPKFRGLVCKPPGKSKNKGQSGVACRATCRTPA